MTVSTQSDKMWTLGTIVAILAGQILVVCCISVQYSASEKQSVTKENDCGKPLFLTQYVDSDEIEKARNLSRTDLLPHAPETVSYSGFFTVNKRYNSNIFFWFFPALNKDKNAPVLLWLQGGPGVSGLFGFFVEHGPYVIHANMSASLREYNWAKTFQIIYVDNPVGTGFSFTDDVKGYVTNQEEMAEDMCEFLQQFFKVFYEYKRNEFYITGESYAGKYIPSLSYKIHSMGPSSNINLKGIAIGNGLCDPETMMDYGDYLYNIGLIDEIQADAMKNLSNTIVSNIRNHRFYDALIGMEKMILNIQDLPYGSLFTNFTGFNFYYNYLHSETPEDYNYYTIYIESPQFRKSLHVGNLTYQDGKMSQKHLLLDIMQTVKPKVAVIMDNYRVLFYNGQLDIVIPYPLTVNFLKTVEWKHAEKYKNVKRRIWKLSGSDKIAGYVHSVKDFHEVLVRNAGHIVPNDQPEFAFDLISRFVNNKSFAS